MDRTLPRPTLTNDDDRALDAAPSRTDDYIVHAFRFARTAAGPDVALYYNDYFDGTSLLVESCCVQLAANDHGSAGGQVPVGNGANGPMTCDQVPNCAAIRSLLADLVETGAPSTSPTASPRRCSPASTTRPATPTSRGE